MPTTAAGWVAAGTVAAGTAAAYSAVKTASETKKAQSEAKKERIRQEEQQKQAYQAELEAGEYFSELTRKQMELQAQSSNIQTLADLIKKKSEPLQPEPQIITTPAIRREPSFIDSLNLQIEQFFGLRG